MLTDNKKVSSTGPTIDYARDLYSAVQLCKMFGWTLHYIESLPNETYEDIIQILNLEDAKQKKTSSKQDQSFIPR